MTAYSLDAFSDILKSHPATIWRHLKLEGDWSRGKNPDIEIEQIVFAFGVSESILSRCLQAKDELLTSLELATILGIDVIQTYSRAYPCVIGLNRHKRYLRSAALQRHSERYADRDKQKKR